MEEDALSFCDLPLIPPNRKGFKLAIADHSTPIPNPDKDLDFEFRPSPPPHPTGAGVIFCGKVFPSGDGNGRHLQKQWVLSAKYKGSSELHPPPFPAEEKTDERPAGSRSRRRALGLWMVNLLLPNMDLRDTRKRHSRRRTKPTPARDGGEEEAGVGEEGERGKAARCLHHLRCKRGYLFKALSRVPSLVRISHV